MTHSNYSSHSSIAAGEPADLARKVAAAAAAVADDAGITREEWTAAAGHAGGEWVNALLRCLYGRSAAFKILNHGLL